MARGTGCDKLELGLETGDPGTGTGSGTGTGYETLQTWVNISRLLVKRQAFVLPLDAWSTVAVYGRARRIMIHAAQNGFHECGQEGLDNGE